MTHGWEGANPKHTPEWHKWNNFANIMWKRRDILIDRKVDGEDISQEVIDLLADIARDCEVIRDEIWQQEQEAKAEALNES